MNVTTSSLKFDIVKNTKELQPLPIKFAGDLLLDQAEKAETRRQKDMNIFQPNFENLYSYIATMLYKFPASTEK